MSKNGGVALRLPVEIRACLFDMDGVITDTARLHFEAWKVTFDRFLAWSSQDGRRPVRPFSPEDYERYVDGRPRLEGVRSFLSSRGIALREGERDDPAEQLTYWGVANQKNDLFLDLIAHGGAKAIEGSMLFVTAARRAGLSTGLVTASANAEVILESIGIRWLFDTVVDGWALVGRHLAGKPAPDSFLAAAADLGVAPSEAAVFEDGRTGVTAARAGGFGYVVGVGIGDEVSALEKAGADLVVGDLAELLDGQLG